MEDIKLSFREKMAMLDNICFFDTKEGAKVRTKVTKYLDDNSFIVTFSINAGNKFKFNEAKLVIPDEYEKSKFKKVQFFKPEASRNESKETYLHCSILKTL